MKRVAAYCRVSTEADDQLNSLDNQKGILENISKIILSGNFADYMLMRV